MKLTNLTPQRLRCIPASCPAVYRTKNNKLVIIGTKATKDIKEELKDKVNVQEEDVVVIDEDFFEHVEKFKKEE